MDKTENLSKIRPCNYIIFQAKNVTMNQLARSVVYMYFILALLGRFNEKTSKNLHELGTINQFVDYYLDKMQFLPFILQPISAIAIAQAPHYVNHSSTNFFKPQDSHSLVHRTQQQLMHLAQQVTSSQATQTTQTTTTTMAPSSINPATTTTTTTTSAAAANGLNSADCSNGLLSFELSTGFIYKPAASETLATLPSTLQLTDCLGYCLQNSSCLAINFEMGLCVLLSSSVKNNASQLYSSQFPVFTIYAEKLCLFSSK